VRKYGDVKYGIIISEHAILMLNIVSNNVMPTADRVPITYDFASKVSSIGKATGIPWVSIWFHSTKPLRGL
jgi:hypothetical protein